MPDEEPKDWEIQDEEPPRQLKEKWAKEEILGEGTVICPSCRQPVSAESLSCLFCGERIMGNPKLKQGFLKQIFEGLKRVFAKRSGK